MKSMVIIISLLFNLVVSGEAEESLRLSEEFVIKDGIEGQDNDLYFKIKIAKEKHTLTLFV